MTSTIAIVAIVAIVAIMAGRHFRARIKGEGVDVEIPAKPPRKRRKR